MNVGVLASGQGTNLQALLDTVHGREVTVVAVASDVAGCAALGRAERAGVPTRVFAIGDHPGRAARDVAIADWLAGHGVELVVLAGYMSLLRPEFLERFPDSVVNVHPSLLPAFPGLHAIEQAIEAGSSVFGVTVHLVDEGIDTGPIISQESVRLPGETDPEAVHRALQPLEHRLLPDAVAMLASRRRAR